ncbi:MAG: DMT family transporter [Clostridia bacterium]|nr:DMT family transporter [Clostridia bacterium]
MKKNTASLGGNLLLLLTAFIWGVAFVAQKSGGAELGALTFNGVRSLIGCGALCAAIPLLDKLGLSHRCDTPTQRKALWTGGLLCGLALFSATNLQQLGLLYTTVGKGGFITALYIVLVPLLGLFFRRRVPLLTWLGVLLAVVGLYLLCGRGETGINIGDLLVLVCALLFAVQIMLVSHYAPLVDGVRLSCIQFLVVGVLNIPLMFCFEQPSLAAIADNWMSVLYAGVLSSGVAYTLQIIAQRRTNPTAASLLMSLESVFAVLAGWVLLGDKLAVAELVGCGLMFAAVLLAQLPPVKGKERSYG